MLELNGDDGDNEKLKNIELFCNLTPLE